MPLFDFLTDYDGNILTTDVSDSIRSFITAILAVLNDSAFDDEFILLILKRLESLGYNITVNDNEVWLIAFSVSDVVSHIKNICNISTIPKELNHIVIERAVGNVLYNVKSTGQSDNLPIDLETAVKSVQTGDTNVTFAIGEGSMTDEQRFDAIVSSLLNTGEGELICFRKIKW